MRNVTIATVFVAVVLGAGIYLYLTEPFNPDRTQIQQLSNSFMEDIQFKDFHSSAQYHHQFERERVDIGKAIEQLFLVDPELIDILDYRITRTEIDSSGTRGRVLVNTRFRPLKPKAVQDEDGDDVEEADLQLFWMLRHPDCPLGSDCDAGLCRDDEGAIEMMEPGDDDEEEEEPYECDDDREHQWFMNLDSTLESRDYQ